MQSSRVLALTTVRLAKVCSIPGCPRPLEPGRSICIHHRGKARSYGAPWITKPLTQAQRKAYTRATRSWITQQVRYGPGSTHFNLAVADALRELSAFLEFRCTERIHIHDLRNKGLTADRKARAIFHAIHKRFGTPELAAHAILAVLIGVQLAVEVEVTEKHPPSFLKAMQCRALFTLCLTPSTRIPVHDKEGNVVRIVKSYRRRPQIAGNHLHDAIHRLVTHQHVPFVLTKTARASILRRMLKYRYSVSDWGFWKKRNSNHSNKGAVRSDSGKV